MFPARLAELHGLREFLEAFCAQAAVAGDVAMLETELAPVLKSLRKNGLDVVAIHHHMTGSRPVVIFLHYWGKGPAEKLAGAFRAALDELGRHGSPSTR